MFYRQKKCNELCGFRLNRNDQVQIVLHCHADALQEIDVVRQTLDNTDGAINMDNPEKLTTLGTQICVEHDYAKTNIYNVNKA